MSSRKTSAVFALESPQPRCGTSFLRRSLRRGACSLVLICMATVGAFAQSTTFDLVLSFDLTDGSGPDAALIQATDGTFYGTTEYGDSCGTVFRMTPSGALTVLHTFEDSDGCLPSAPLLEVDSNFYGTTAYGGSNCPPGGCGTIFRITAEGVFTTVFNFGGADGIGPGAGLLQGNDGNFYSTTIWGGTNYECISGCGTIFKLTPAGELTTLYDFCSQPNCTDGWYPVSALVQTADGSFYGTTKAGGANPPDGCGYGYCGTIFKLSSAGALTTLYSFCSQPNCTDGSAPEASLLLGWDGNFYGTTSFGGANGYGTVFKITSAGELTTLHSFDFNDGAFPSAGLVQGTDGYFYGTTTIGGTGPCDFSGCGTVFQITSAGAFTTLHKFVYWDGRDPAGGLVEAADGSFYGTTQNGGSYCNYGNGCGTVFRLGVVDSCTACRP